MAYIFGQTPDTATAVAPTTAAPVATQPMAPDELFKGMVDIYTREEERGPNDINLFVLISDELYNQGVLLVDNGDSARTVLDVHTQSDIMFGLTNKRQRSFIGTVLSTYIAGAATPDNIDRNAELRTMLLDAVVSDNEWLDRVLGVIIPEMKELFS